MRRSPGPRTCAVRSSCHTRTPMDSSTPTSPPRRHRPVARRRRPLAILALALVGIMVLGACQPERPSAGRNTPVRRVLIVGDSMTWGLFGTTSRAERAHHRGDGRPRHRHPHRRLRRQHDPGPLARKTPLDRRGPTPDHLLEPRRGHRAVDALPRCDRSGPPAGLRRRRPGAVRCGGIAWRTRVRGRAQRSEQVPAARRARHRPVHPGARRRPGCVEDPARLVAGTLHGARTGPTDGT